MNAYDLVAWKTWNAAGYSVGVSKGHVEDDDNPNRALCGITIPQAGNGIEVDNAADLGAQECRRCERADAVRRRGEA